MTEIEAIYCTILESDTAKKTLRRLLTETILTINEQSQHSLFKAIMRRAKELMDDGFDKRDAIASAVSYRKHEIHNLLHSP